jgi:hypothetical protein
MSRSTNPKGADIRRLDFAHQPGKDDSSIDSVCMNCLQTVGSSDKEWDLAGCEFFHSLQCWKKKPKSPQRIV